MARELKIFETRKAVKHPHVIITLECTTVDEGYHRGRIVPKDETFTWTGKVLNRKGEGFKLPHWLEETVPGSFAAAVKAASPEEKEPISAASKAPVAPVAPKTPAASKAPKAPAIPNAGDLV